MFAPALALAICAAYAASLWWLLRRESAAAIAGVVALTGLALVVRIWYTTDFPNGLIEDEPKMLRCAGEAFKTGRIYDGECVGMPMLFQTLFEAQLVPIVGPTRWAIRSFSLVTSVLAVPAAYAVGRGLALRVLPSLAIGALVACLPWSIFFGRISLGGELVFHQLLLLAALVRLIFVTGSWVDIFIGAIGLCGLLHDYFCGRAMVPMTLVAAVLARGRYRLFCVAVLVLAIVGWLPYVTGIAPSATIGVTAAGSRPGMDTNLIATLWASTYATFRSLVPPAGGRDSWFTIRSAGIHPPLLLALAALGALTGVRRGLFLWAVFLGGLAPSIVSEGQFPSSHRMLMAFPAIAVAVGCALNLVPTRVLRTLATLVVAGLACGWGVWFYFSPAFWPVESLSVFGQERTAVVDALPLPPHPQRLIVMKHLGYYFGARTLVDQNYEVMTVDNWVPADGTAAIYAFDPFAAPLRPFYERLVGSDRVQQVGRAFIVSMEAREWSWIKRHGWAYEARCGDQVQRAIVPTLYQELLGFRTLVCNDPITHVWRGRWKGPTTQLRLRFNGTGKVETPRGVSVTKVGEQMTIDFSAEPDDELRVTLVNSPPDTSPLAHVVEVTPMTERVPFWESVDAIVETGDGSGVASSSAPAPPARVPG